MSRRKIRDRNDLENAAYNGMIGHLEELEHKRVYTGNSHHLAQILSKMVVDKMIKDWEIILVKDLEIPDEGKSDSERSGGSPAPPRRE